MAEDLICRNDFNELMHCKSAFESGVKAYRNAWKRIEGKKTIFKVETKKAIFVNYLDLQGFTKKELEFINFLLLDKLRHCSDREKELILRLNSQVSAKINSKVGCVNCGSIDVHKKGQIKHKFGTTQNYQCKNCGAKFSFGAQNTKWDSIVELIRLYMSGYSVRKIEDELIMQGKHSWNFAKVNGFLNDIKPFLRPRFAKISEFKKWLVICKKCKKGLKKVKLDFNYCPDCNVEISQKYRQLHEKILEEALYAIQDDRNRKHCSKQA